MFATGGWFGIVTMAIACHHTRTACHATLSPVAPLGPTAMNCKTKKEKNLNKNVNSYNKNEKIKNKGQAPY